jgi:3'-phosphoadenosine 5'-phosphosulfate (PAPS) 3'-phosphatase
VSRDLDDHAVARTLAEAAARLLLELRGSPPDGGDPQHLRDEGDRRAQSLIAQLLADSRPGDADIYLHAGGQYEWDSAAPVAVALDAGLHASRLDGSPLRYNRPDPSIPDLLICRPELALEVLSAVRAVHRG